MIAEFAVLFLMILFPQLVTVPAKWLARLRLGLPVLSSSTPCNGGETMTAVPHCASPLAAVAALFATAAAQAQVQDRSFKFATQNPKGHPIVIGMEKFAEIVAAKSGGKMKVNLFPGGVLGGDAPNVSALQGGTIEMVVLNSGILASQAKEFGVYDFPFMFANPKEADTVVDGAVRQDDAPEARAEGHRRPRVLGARLPQHHQQPAPDHQGRGHRRPEAARDPQRHQRRLGEGARRQPDADGLPRGLHRARAEGDRRPGEPGHGDQRQQVLRSAEERRCSPTTSTTRSR